MIDVHGIGAHGIYPFLSDDVIKQARSIKSRAGKIAYIMTVGEKAGAPKVKEGVEEARGALKWIFEAIKEENK